MAVQKSRKSRATRGMRRGHQKLKPSALSVDVETGETHRRHHMTASGYYKGRQVIIQPESSEVETSESETQE